MSPAAQAQSAPTVSPVRDTFATRRARAGSTGRLSVPGHPIPALDDTEAATFARDILYARVYGLSGAKAKLWLATRARARRDMLWLARSLLGLDRLSETIHRPPADFLTDIFTTRHGFGNLRDPRGNGKTSLSTITGPVWIAIQDPIECIARRWPIRGRDSRLGVSALKIEMTREFMRVLMTTFDGAEDLQFAFPEILPEVKDPWNLGGFNLRRGLRGDLAPLADEPLFARYPRATRAKDPTFAARSLESVGAGPHSHGEIIDDPVNDRTWNSPVNIASAVHGIRQLFNITRPEQGFRLVTGNDWSPTDVNATIDTDGDGWRVFARDSVSCAVCCDGIPVDPATGAPPKTPAGLFVHEHDAATWTHLMVEADGSTPDLADIRKRCGSIHIFMAQYRNSPTAGEATYWSADQLRPFEILKRHPVAADLLPPPSVDPTARDRALLMPLGPEDIVRFGLLRPREVVQADGSKRIVTEETCRVRDLSITLSYDPAHGSTNPKSSEHALTALGRGPDDSALLLGAWSGRITDPLAPIDMLVSWIRLLHPRRVAVEAVGYQKTVKFILIRALKRFPGVLLNPERDIVPIHRGADKDQDTYIRDALGPVIGAGELRTNDTVPGTRKVTMQIEGAPILRPNDLVNSLAFHTALWDARAPQARAERVATTRRAWLASKMRARNAGVTGYGKMPF